MSALDDILNFREADWYAARAELAALRASEKYWQEQAETQRAEAAAQRERAEKYRFELEAELNKAKEK